MRNKIRFTIYFLQTFLQRHKKEISAGIILGFFATLLLIKIYPLYIKLIGRKYQIIGIVGNYREGNLPLFIQRQISYGLTQIDPNGEVKPLTAESWEVNQTGTSYTFHLKKDLHWHDDLSFISKDINYSLKGVELEIIDKYTFKINLKDTYAPLLTQLSKPLIRKGLIGLGEYKVIKIQKKGEIITHLYLSSVFDQTLPLITYKFIRIILMQYLLLS